MAKKEKGTKRAYAKKKMEVKKEKASVRQKAAKAKK